MSTKKQAPWEIPARSRICARAGEALMPGMAVYSELVDVRDDDQSRRRDFCTTCWDIEQQERDMAAVTHWRSLILNVAPERDPRKEERNNQLLLGLRVALASERDSEAFVLSLYLVRLRKLVRRQALMHEGAPCVLYEVADSGEALLVPTLAMSASEMERLFQSLVERVTAPS